MTALTYTFGRREPSIAFGDVVERRRDVGAKGNNSLGNREVGVREIVMLYSEAGKNSGCRDQIKEIYGPKG